MLPLLYILIDLYDDIAPLRKGCILFSLLYFDVYGDKVVVKEGMHDLFKIRFCYFLDWLDRDMTIKLLLKWNIYSYLYVDN